MCRGQLPPVVCKKLILLIFFNANYRISGPYSLWEGNANDSAQGPLVERVGFESVQGPLVEKIG